MPWQESLAWLDHHQLPCPGALHDQPWILWWAMGWVISGIVNERSARQKAEEAQMIAEITNR